MLTKKIFKNLFVPQNKYEQDVLNLYLLLVENFSQSFFVGGMVRDLLLGIRPTDFDITTSAQPEKIVKVLSESGYDLDLSAIRFGIIKVSVRESFVEIATFRKEVYNDSRYPKITFTKNLEIDSKRRDYTLNALYFQAKSQTVIDPQGGLKDIKTRTLKLIGEGKLRLEEDPLRIVRGYRLAKEFNLTFERKTANLIDNNISLTSKLSQTRLQSEVNKSKTISVKKYLQKVFRKYLHKKK